MLSQPRNTGVGCEFRVNASAYTHSNRGEDMKNAVTRILLSGVTMLLLACAQVPPDENGDGIVESAQQPDDAKLVFSSLELDRTNRGSININGYDRHFSVTFPTSYDNNVAYPVVLFFHGCMCRPSFTEQFIKSYLDWKPRLDSYKDDFITIREETGSFPRG